MNTSTNPLLNPGMPALRLHAIRSLIARAGIAWNERWRPWRRKYPRAAQCLPQGLAMLAVLLGSCGIGWLLPYRAAQADLQQLRRQEVALKQAYLRQLQRAPRTDVAQGRKRHAEQGLALLEQQLAGAPEQEAVMNEIDAAGLARGLRFTLFKPEAEPAGGPHERIAIRMQATGSYQAIARFAGDIAHLPRIVVLDPLALQSADDGDSPSDGMLMLSATASAYRQTGAARPAGHASDATPASEREKPQANAAAALTGPDREDLQNWLAAARRQSAANAAAVEPLEHSAPNPTIATAERIPGDRDPFAPPLHRTATISGIPTSPDTEHADAIATAALHMLGTVRERGIAYALIQADQQLFCVAPHAPLPSYPLTVAAVTDHAVELEQRLQDGSLRRSTLRLGE
ncbi:MAG: pilus assembly protein PilO [Herbaspirillum sp.]|nr:pilus assembly protein PilO [Herbaspirillum sp.]